MDGNNLIFDLLTEPEFRLPMDGEDDLPGQLRRIVDAYLRAVEGLPDSPVTASVKAGLADIRLLSEGIVRTVQAQLEGTWHRAFSNSRDALRTVLPLIAKSVVRWIPANQGLDVRSMKQ